jgi:phenylacetate-CoA ligase
MNSKFYNPQFETLSQDELSRIQLERLKDRVKFVYDNNAIQRERYKKTGVEPGDVKTLEDIEKLPMMDKELLRTSYPMELSCVDKTEIKEMHMSSGSTGTPVVMPYTAADLEQWAECMARCYYMAGARANDVVQITPSFGLFNGGFGMYHGARAAGMFVIPAGAGNTERQIKLASDFGTRVLTGVVSYGIRIMEVLEQQGRELPELKIGIFGAEAFSDGMKDKLTKGLGIDVYDIYGMTETGGVGTLGMDCCAHNGIHVWEDHYIVELVNPATGKAVADGEHGELVFTSLTRQALPVIRFKTGDLSRVISREKCECGRTHIKIEAITGRVDDMLIVKGVNFWPKQVEHALMQIPGIGSNYQIILENTAGVQNVRVNVEAEGSVTGHMVCKVLKEALGFAPEGDVFPIGGLPRQEGKAIRVFHGSSNVKK